MILEMCRTFFFFFSQIETPRAKFAPYRIYAFGVDDSWNVPYRYIVNDITTGRVRFLSNFYVRLASMIFEMCRMYPIMKRFLPVVFSSHNEMCRFIPIMKKRRVKIASYQIYVFGLVDSEMCFAVYFCLKMKTRRGKIRSLSNLCFWRLWFL